VTSATDARPGATVTKKVRVVVGDDHPLFGDGVIRALAFTAEVDVVAQADDGAAALELIKTQVPDVAPRAHRMPGTHLASCFPSYRTTRRGFGVSGCLAAVWGRVYRLTLRLAPNNCQDALSK
jgi:DNA-binding NarL/FixJ family response regulator